MKRWYIIHAYSGFEKQVMRSLNERIQRSTVADSFGEVLVPTEEVVEMKDGKKRKSERKFFPGYVLVEMEMNGGLSVSSASIQRPMFFTDLIDSPTDEWITTFMQDFVRLTAVGSVCFIRLLTAHSGIDRSTALRMSPGRRTTP